MGLFVVTRVQKSERKQVDDGYAWKRHRTGGLVSRASYIQGNSSQL